MNPHFLFNAFNCLSSLIMLRRLEDAELTTLRLSSFLRKFLSADPTGRWDLGYEIDLIRTYLSIEQVRFPDRLTVQIDIPVGLTGALVPSFVLQPLVEDAVNRAVGLSLEPVTLNIWAVASDGVLQLSVSDEDMPGANRADPLDHEHLDESSADLAPLRNRLAALDGGDGKLFRRGGAGGETLTLRLPLVHR